MQRTRTLVLNKVWYPIGNVNWTKAFKLLCKGRAEVLEYYEETILTPSDEHFVPAVIRLVYYDKIPKTKVSYSKRAVLERDEYLCQYCDRELTKGTATIDHVMPRSHGGKTTFENTVASCHSCNNKKGNKLPKHSPLKLNKKPERPSIRHFRPKFGKMPNEEWFPYIPKGILNELQAYS